VITPLTGLTPPHPGIVCIGKEHGASVAQRLHDPFLLGLTLHSARREDPQRAIDTHLLAVQQSGRLAKLFERRMRASQHDEVHVWIAGVRIQAIVHAALLGHAVSERFDRRLRTEGHLE
jgi:hypothetical protein